MVGQLLDVFGSMISGVGSLASSTLPCAISATKSLTLSTVGGASAKMSVDFGYAPQVATSLRLIAADPIEGGMLTSIAAVARESGVSSIEIAYTYRGLPLRTRFPYDQIECPTRRPPDYLIPPLRLRRAIRNLIETVVTVSALSWTSLCKYGADWFTSLDQAAIDEIATEVRAAAAEAQVPITLEELAKGMYDVIPRRAQ